MPKHRTVKRSRRNKKRNGGMFSQKALMGMKSPEGVSHELVSKAQTGPGSGMLAVLMKKLHRPPSSDLPVPVGVVPPLLIRTVHSKGNEAFANAMFEETTVAPLRTM